MATTDKRQRPVSAGGVAAQATAIARPPDGVAPTATRTHNDVMHTMAARRAATWVGAVPVAVLLLAYAIPLLIVPPTLSVPLIDSWNYQLSVRRLVEEGELWVAPWTATTLLLQIGWGALFAWPLGVDAVSLRWAGLVASFGGTLAAYALFRELGIVRGRALIGALAVWLNPLVFGLSYTFMTDVPFLSLMTAAVWATVRAVNRASLRWLAVASVLAGAAFLVRQQGVLLPLGTLAWLVLARPAWFRASLRQAALTVAAVLGPCLLAVAAYYLWAANAGVPPTQGDYLDSLRAAGVRGTLDLTWRLAVVALFYIGIFVFPVVVGGLVAVPHAWHRAGIGQRHLAVGLVIGAVLWTRWFHLTHDRRSFPFVPWGGMLHEDGLGVLDADGLRPFFFERWQYAAIGLVFAAVTAAGLLLLTSERRVIQPLNRLPWGRLAPRWSLNSTAGLFAVLAAAQFAGIVPPSMHIRGWITFDRYYLPLIPFVLGAVLLGLRGRRFSPSLAVVALCLFAAVNLVGLQDWFAFKQAQWDAAEWLVEERNIPIRSIDGAVQWDGLHFYEYSLAHPEDRVARRPGDLWWLYIVAPMIDPLYVVAAAPTVRNGYYVYETRPYESWIRTDEEELIYIWRREPRPVLDNNG